LFGPSPEHDRVGVVSLVIDGFDPQDVGAILDQTFGVETRVGLHCAPGAHRAIGSFDSGGTVRLSVGPFTTADDVAQAIEALRAIAGAA
jgi:selenocysteine lyase/cysteine desulfurase